MMRMNVGHRMKVYMADKMIGCDQAGYLVSKSREAKLSVREKIGLRFHLMTCHVCRKYEQQLNDLNHMTDLYREQCTNGSVVHLLDEESRASLRILVDKELGRS